MAWKAVGLGKTAGHEPHDCHPQRGGFGVSEADYEAAVEDALLISPSPSSGREKPLFCPTEVRKKLREREETRVCLKATSFCVLCPDTSFLFSLSFSPSVCLCSNVFRAYLQAVRCLRSRRKVGPACPTYMYAEVGVFQSSLAGLAFVPREKACRPSSSSSVHARLLVVAGEAVGAVEIPQGEGRRGSVVGSISHHAPGTSASSSFLVFLFLQTCCVSRQRSFKTPRNVDTYLRGGGDFSRGAVEQ